MIDDRTDIWGMRLLFLDLSVAFDTIGQTHCLNSVIFGGCTKIAKLGLLFYICHSSQGPGSHHFRKHTTQAPPASQRCRVYLQNSTKWFDPPMVCCVFARKNKSLCHNRSTVCVPSLIGYIILIILRRTWLCILQFI